MPTSFRYVPVVPEFLLLLLLLTRARTAHLPVLKVLRTPPSLPLLHTHLPATYGMPAAYTFLPCHHLLTVLLLSLLFSSMLHCWPLGWETVPLAIPTLFLRTISLPLLYH